MQRSRHPACTFPLLGWRFPIPFQCFPHGFPVLRCRFHDHFLDFLLEQPGSQPSQLFGVATEHPPLKLILPVDFNVRDNYRPHPFMNIDSPYPVSHNVSPGREWRACCSYTNQGHGLSPLPQRNTTTPNYSLNHARSGSDMFTASTFPMLGQPRRSKPFTFCLTLGDFHEVSWAARP